MFVPCKSYDYAKKVEVTAVLDQLKLPIEGCSLISAHLSDNVNLAGILSAELCKSSKSALS